MASPKVVEALAQPASPDADPSAKYKTILMDIKNLSPPASLTADLAAIADSLIDASLGTVATRSALNYFITTLKALNDADLSINVGEHVIAIITNTPSLATSLFEQVISVRELVASAHEFNEDWVEAAKALAHIPLDSSQRRVTNADKARLWIRIVRNYLEADDAGSAESYLNKLKNVMHNIHSDGPSPALDADELHLHFKLSAARIQDSNRQFLQAAMSYHDISFSPHIADEERLHTLAMAVKCAVLAPAGPLRSRALARLYADQRTTSLDEFSMLEKIFLDRLLSAQEVERFSKGLAPHQLATTADGSTVLAKAVVEHNLLSAGRVYRNISFTNLGVLLNLSPEKAEETTARMIEQGRLAGSIDQIDEIIYFEGSDASGEKGSGRAAATVGREMRRWDANVQALNESVEKLADRLSAEFPDFLSKRLTEVPAS